MANLIQGIPQGITVQDVEQAIGDYAAGTEHGFADSIAYDLIYNGKAYPPKAILGLAARRLNGGVALSPIDFKGGEGSKCFRVLRKLGFVIVPKSRSSTPRYWWVNQNQTYKAEVEGGYIWSPKRSKDEKRNQFYENMREVAPGDVIFSFRNTQIAAVGIASSLCHEAPKPDEFGTSGSNWSNVGWRVAVTWKKFGNPIQPKQILQDILPFLNDKYSPLQKNGDGLQGVYLAAISDQFAQVLLKHLQAGNSDFELPDAQANGPEIDEITKQHEETIEEEIKQENIPETTKQQLVKARIGQGKFRENVLKIEKACRVTQIGDPSFLVASHIKPWSRSNNQERLDGNNGLMLAPHIDFLFDRGLITFQDTGELLISPVLSSSVVEKFGLFSEKPISTGSFMKEQQLYLAFHRREIFLSSHCDE